MAQRDAVLAELAGFTGGARISSQPQQAKPRPKPKPKKKAKVGKRRKRRNKGDTAMARITNATTQMAVVSMEQELAAEEAALIAERKERELREARKKDA